MGESHMNCIGICRCIWTIFSFMRLKFFNSGACRFLHYDMRLRRWEKWDAGTLDGCAVWMHLVAGFCRDDGHKVSSHQVPILDEFYCRTALTSSFAPSAHSLTRKSLSSGETLWLSTWSTWYSAPSRALRCTQSCFAFAANLHTGSPWL
jgi:hypothetical protein